MTFADAEYAGKRNQTRKKLFLIEMDQVVPWKGLIALIEPHYPNREGDRLTYPLMAMLRVHLALEPVTETRADPNSYGFRPQRSTTDTIVRCFNSLVKRSSVQCVL